MKLDQVAFARIAEEPSAALHVNAENNRQLIQEAAMHSEVLLFGVPPTIA